MTVHSKGSLKAGLLLVSCAVSALSAGTLHAQTDAPPATDVAETEVEEITVTARRIKENIQDVPIAITALSAQRLEEAGGTSIADLGNMSPSVHINSVSPINGSSNTPNINIRGIGTTDFLLTIDPSVGVYVDGVYVSRTVGGLFDLLDLDRVEVLRGPQGTLFGRNTIGGAVQLVSRAPNNEFRLSASATVGSYNRFDVRAAISGPIAENLFASLAFSRKTQDGYGNLRDFFADNPALASREAALRRITVFDERTGALLSGNTSGLAPGALIAGGNIIAFADEGERPGNVNNWSTRGSLVFEPSDSIKFTLIGDYAKTDETSPALVLLKTFFDDFSAPTPSAVNPLTGNRFAVNLAGAHNLNFGAATVLFNDANFVIGDNYSAYDTGPGASLSEVWGASLTGEFDLSSQVTLKSITAYRYLDSLFGQDPDHSPIVLDAHTNAITQDQISQEIQLLGSFGNLNAVIGGYYFTEKGSDRVIVPLLEGLAVLDENNEVKNRSFALFTQETYKITDQTSLTAGIRYTHEKKDYAQTHLDCGIANALGVPTTAVVNNCLSLSTGRASQKFNNVSYLLNVSHRFNQNVMVYGSFSTGFKSGGFTGRTTAYIPSQTPVPFGPEKARSFELGVKTNARGIRFNVALFNTDYKGIQLVVQNGVAPITVNGADARIRGAEFEAQFKPFDGFTIDTSVSLLDAKFTTARPVNIGSNLPNTPKFSSSLALSYKVPVSDTFNVTLFANATYKSRVYSNSENTPELVEPSAHEINASIKFSDKDDRFSLTAGGRNLTNQATLITGFFQPGVGYTEGVFSRPAQWYLTAGFKY